MKVFTFCNILESHIPRNGKGHEWVQILVVFVAASGALSCTTIGAWTSPSIPILTSNVSHIQPITLEEASYLTVIPPIAALASAPLLSLIVDSIGRKKTIMLLATFQFLSWILVAFADSLSIFYLARVFAGFGEATVFTVIPMYIGEVTQPNIRNTWGNLVAFFAFLGQFLINLIGSYFNIAITAFILSCAPLLQFLLVVFMPESPYFLLMKRKDRAAKTSLEILMWTHDVEKRFATLSKTVQQQIAEAGSFKDLFSTATHRKTLLMAAGVRAFQQFSGIPVFFMYTQYIFNQAGSDISASSSAILYSGVFLIVMTSFAFFIGKFGRKPLLILSCISCGVVLAIEAVYFYILEKTFLDVSNFTWIPLAGMIMYVPASALGLAIIPILMLGELFDTTVKGKAMCILNICYSASILIVAKLFHVLSVNFGMFVPFCLFAVCCFVNAAFSYLFVPETKGKTLEEIQLKLKHQKN